MQTSIVAMLAGVRDWQEPTISFFSLHEGIWGEIEKEKVQVMCVPKDLQFVKDNFSDLPELDYNP